MSTQSILAATTEISSQYQSSSQAVSQVSPDSNIRSAPTIFAGLFSAGNIVQDLLSTMPATIGRVIDTSA